MSSKWQCKKCNVVYRHKQVEGPVYKCEVPDCIVRYKDHAGKFYLYDKQILSTRRWNPLERTLVKERDISM